MIAVAAAAYTAGPHSPRCRPRSDSSRTRPRCSKARCGTRKPASTTSTASHWSSGRTPRSTTRWWLVSRGFVDKAKLFYDKAKAVGQLLDTEVVDDELAKHHKELTIQLAELDFQRRLLELKKLQAGLALDSALQIKHVAEQDQQAIEQLAANLGSDVAILARLAGRLIRSAQVYVDLYTQYAFFAARALDLYTLEDHYAPTFSFGLGYVDPDDEADALLLVDDGQPKKFLSLVEKYQNTVSTLPDPFLLKNAYDAYDQSLTTVQNQYWNFTDPKVLNALRTTGQAAVRIPLSSVPASRYELKILQVYLSLTGAVGENETILVALEHTGNAENRKLPSSNPIILSAPPRRSIVAATVDESLLPRSGTRRSGVAAQPRCGA